MKNINKIAVVDTIGLCCTIGAIAWLSCAAAGGVRTAFEDRLNRTIGGGGAEASAKVAETAQAAQKPRTIALPEEYANGDLVFSGAKLDDDGERVSLTLSFVRKRETASR